MFQRLFIMVLILGLFQSCEAVSLSPELGRPMGGMRATWSPTVAPDGKLIFAESSPTPTTLEDSSTPPTFTSAPILTADSKNTSQNKSHGISLSPVSGLSTISPSAVTTKKLKKSFIKTYNNLKRSIAPSAKKSKP